MPINYSLFGISQPLATTFWRLFLFGLHVMHIVMPTAIYVHIFITLNDYQIANRRPYTHFFRIGVSCNMLTHHLNPQICHITSKQLRNE